jgi:Mn2+/Fe2+ NRAMP family transporter
VAGLSPGIVAGASDGDPTTVTTLAVVGAQTGFSLAWSSFSSSVASSPLRSRNGSRAR